MEKPEKFEIKICQLDGELEININGESHTAENFEFSAPFVSDGFKIRRITRVELGPKVN